MSKDEMVDNNHDVKIFDDVHGILYFLLSLITFPIFFNICNLIDRIMRNERIILIF